MISVRGELFLPVDQALKEQEVEEVHELRRAIIEAVRDQDAAHAAKQMRASIRHARVMFQRAFEASFPPTADPPLAAGPARTQEEGKSR